MLFEQYQLNQTSQQVKKLGEKIESKRSACFQQGFRRSSISNVRSPASARTDKTSHLCSFGMSILSESNKLEAAQTFAQQTCTNKLPLRWSEINMRMIHLILLFLHLGCVSSKLSRNFKLSYPSGSLLFSLSNFLCRLPFPELLCSFVSLSLLFSIFRLLTLCAKLDLEAVTLQSSTMDLCLLPLPPTPLRLRSKLQNLSAVLSPTAGSVRWAPEKCLLALMHTSTCIIAPLPFLEHLQSTRTRTHIHPPPPSLRCQMPKSHRGVMFLHSHRGYVGHKHTHTNMDLHIQKMSTFQKEIGGQPSGGAACQ